MAKKIIFKRSHQSIGTVIDRAAKRRVRIGNVRPPVQRLNRLGGRFLPVKIEPGKPSGRSTRAPEIQPTAVPQGRGVVMIIPGSERILPHTLIDRRGRKVQTQKWINRAFLVIFTSQAARGPMLGLAGPNFRCYYPNSSGDDLRAILGSGSSGRWLNAWSQKSNYIKF